jgi:hypothetical protein
MAEIRRAEIFSAGTWNGLTFTDDDLDAIVRSFEELGLGGRIPLKFGHNDEQRVTDGQPALGWVQRVWREGSRVFADLTKIPTVVFDAIKQELYKFVSVELLQDAERSGARYPWVLSAVALLGADPPAVGNLSDLSRLALTDRLSHRRVVTFSRAGHFNINGDRKAMPTTEELLGRIASLEAESKRFSDEAKALKAERDAAVEQRTKEKADSIRAAVEHKFEAAIEAKVLLPSARERYFKWTFPKEVEKIVEFDPKEADTFIEENKVNMSDNRTAGAGTKQADEEGKTPDVVVSQRVRIFMSENNGMTYKDAMVAVLRDDPSLADDYRHMPDKHYK